VPVPVPSPTKPPRAPRRPAAAPTPRQAAGLARRGGLPIKAVGSFIPRLTARAFERFGFSTLNLIMDWPAIVGSQLAAASSPERLKWPPRGQGASDGGDDGEREPTRRRGASLLIRVDGAHALEFQYQSRQILERINAYFGYAAVTELRLLQAPLVPLVPPTPPRVPRRQRCEAAAPAALASIGDAALRAALSRLGSQLGAAG